jgi:hypothetical protein
MLAQLINNRSWIILLLLSRKTFSFVENDLLLSGRTLFSDIESIDDRSRGLDDVEERAYTHVEGLLNRVQRPKPGARR